MSEERHNRRPDALEEEEEEEEAAFLLQTGLSVPDGVTHDLDRELPMMVRDDKNFSARVSIRQLVTISC